MLQTISVEEVLGEERTVIKAWAAAFMLDEVPFGVQTRVLEAWLDLQKKHWKSWSEAGAPAARDGCQDMPHQQVPKAFSTHTRQRLILQPSFQQYCSSVSWEG